MLSNLLVQLVNGLADASTLFLVAAGLSLIFGVTRIVNFAHGSFYMFGIYVAYSIASRFGHSTGGFWLSVLAAALLVAVLGALVEMIVLRRIYQAPELFHLLATFALVLIFRDAALWLWGPEDLFGPRAPHLAGAVNLLGHPLPTYDIALIVIGPVVLLLLWYALTRTRWGTLVRAATQDREMLGALGINQAWLFTGVFFVGAFLAGLGGALQGPRMSANLSLDLETIGNAFVVVVVGGMGSIPGAFVAALLIAEIKALCIGIGHVSIGGIDFSLSRFTLVAEFVVMAVVLVVRPWGLFGKASAAVRGMAAPEAPLRPAGKRLKWLAVVALVVLAVAPLAANAFPYMPILLVEILIAVLFATSLHFIMGPGGMHSFGHAAYFGLGAYGAALLIVGAAGELEHGALWHVPGGYAMRELLEKNGVPTNAIVPSTKKVGAPSTALDVPMTHVNASYVRSHFDAIEVRVPGAPAADEVVYILAMSTGQRVHARVGGLAKEDIVGKDGLR